MIVAGGNPDTLAPPIGPFRHFTEAPDDHRLVFVSGQIGQDASGSIPHGCVAQTRQMFRNLEMILAELDVGPQHVVKLFTIVAGEGSWADFTAVRTEVFARWYPDGVYPAHSGFVAVALASPALTVELEAVIAVPR